MVQYVRSLSLLRYGRAKYDGSICAAIVAELWGYVDVDDFTGLGVDAIENEVTCNLHLVAANVA